MANPKPFETDVKRFRWGGKLTRACPKCGTRRTLDGMRDDYLSYPTANEPFDLGFYCHECDHEWSVRVVLHVHLEAVKPPKAAKAQ